MTLEPGALLGLLSGALLQRQLARPQSAARLPEARYLTYSGHDYSPDGSRVVIAGREMVSSLVLLDGVGGLGPSK